MLDRGYVHGALDGYIGVVFTRVVIATADFAIHLVC